MVVSDFRRIAIRVVALSRDMLRTRRASADGGKRISRAVCIYEYITHDTIIQTPCTHKFCLWCAVLC